MKQLLITLLFIPFFTNAQTYMYVEANADTRTKTVSGGWKKSTIIDRSGRVIEGEVRGYLYKGDDVKSFRYRPDKDSKGVTYKADDCLQVFYDDLIIVSLPKNLKKPAGKRQFYITIYFGEHLSILQDPNAKVAEAQPNSFIMNEGQMLNLLAFKDNKIYKLSKLKFRKQIRKLLADSPEWTAKAADKKWLKYDNIYEVANFYNEAIKNK